MRRRLLTAMLLVAVLAVAGFGLPLALSVQALYRDQALLLLSEEAARAAVAVPASFAGSTDLPELPKQRKDVALALYDTAGRRLLGAGPATADSAVIDTLRGGTGQRRPSELVVTVPISKEETVVGVIRASQPAGVVAAKTRRTWAIMGGLAAVVLSAAGLLAAGRSRSLAQPLARLRADAELIGAGGELAERPGTGIAEIDAVRAALADAASRLNGALERERSLSADLAHQLRTPLASLRLRLETEQLAAGAQSPLLRDALVDVERLQQTMDDVLHLARDTERTRESHPLATLLRDAATRWEPRLASTGRRLRLTVEPQLPWVDASPAAVRQILDVLIDNALQHGKGEVLLSGGRVGHGAVVAVSDQGGATLEAGEVFLRRNAAAAGSGIGLALARRLAEAEDMRLVLHRAGPGPVFHLVFVGRGVVRS